jgi:hypothetical protein
MRTILLILFIFLTVGSASAVDRHVQKTGSSDANLCTLASPCLTIGRGITVMQSGETLFIHAGTYTEHIGSYSGGVEPLEQRARTQ